MNDVTTPSTSGSPGVPDVLQLSSTPVAAKPKKALWIFAAVTGVTVILDQLSKAWIRSALPVNDEIAVVPGWVHLSHILNHGAAWGMLSGQRWLLVLIAFLVGGAVIWLARQEQADSPWMRFALGLILGGALGNLIDRIATGAVTDMIDLDTPIAWLHNFPVFNLADSALTVGVTILALEALLRRPKLED